MPPSIFHHITFPNSGQYHFRLDARNLPIIHFISLGIPKEMNDLLFETILIFSLQGGIYISGSNGECPKPHRWPKTHDPSMI
jgi:hypothetical protein